MIQIHSTGRPVFAATLRPYDQIIVDGKVLTVLTVRALHDYAMVGLVVKPFTGEPYRVAFRADSMVHLAQEESLDNPATACEVYLALTEKGAI
jgi:hypothetical protein